MSRKGYIYIIKNDINDKVYVGQTARDIQIRFHEHCWDSRYISYPSELHNAIKNIGYKKGLYYIAHPADKQ